MAWPPQVQKAEDRMLAAKAELQADIDSGQYNVKRRNELVAKFNRAMNAFSRQVVQLAKKFPKKK
jgi:hypothetical protein